MEYFRDPKNQIYADQAFRLGKILIQYEKMNIDEEKFEATLYLSVLQNLLTNSNEYVRQMTKGERNNSIFKKNISDAIWGLNESCWHKNTFNEDRTLQNFITRIRNSVSHPTNIDITSEFPSTGYSTIKNQSGMIKEFRFINSPDTRNNRPKKHTSIKAVENTIYQREKINDKVIHNEFPSDISYEKIEVNGKTHYNIVSKGEPFVRVSIIDLTVSQLCTFVKSLANYLAQPIQENWDGITIKELIAA
jgi:hypothetical protein